MKFVIQQVQITILEYLEEEEHMPILYMEELQALLQPIWVIFVIKDVVVMEVREILSDLNKPVVAEVVLVRI